MDKQNSRWQPMTLREIVGLFVLPIKKPPDGKEKPMNVFKVSFSHAWDKWHDFTFVTCRSKSEAIQKAMAEIDIPEVANEKLIITVALESRMGKRKVGK